MCSTIPVFLGGISKVIVPTRFVIGAGQVVAIITVMSRNHGHAGKRFLLTGVWVTIFWLILDLC